MNISNLYFFLAMSFFGKLGSFFIQNRQLSVRLLLWDLSDAAIL